MRFGIFDHMEFREGSLGDLYKQRLEMLEFADNAGFWCYHKAEHHFIKLDAAPSSNVFLAAASQRTERIRFGPLVYLLPFHNPIRLLEEICMLDHLCEGRLEIGVGKGISPAEHSLWGRSPTQARNEFEEVFSILRNGFQNNILNHEGPQYRFRDVPLQLRPKQKPHPPFWYPGNVHYAATHKLNTIAGGPSSRVVHSAKTYRDILQKTDINWNPGVSTPTLGVLRHVYVTNTDAQALSRVRRAYAVYHDHLAKLFKTYHVPFQAPGDPSLGGDVDAALAFEVLIVGSPDTIIQQIQKMRDDAGIDYFVSAFAWGDLSHSETMESLSLFVSEVIPAFSEGVKS